MRNINMFRITSISMMVMILVLLIIVLTLNNFFLYSGTYMYVLIGLSLCIGLCRTFHSKTFFNLLSNEYGTIDNFVKVLKNSGCKIPMFILKFNQFGSYPHLETYIKLKGLRFINNDLNVMIKYMTLEDVITILGYPIIMAIFVFRIISGT